MERVIQCCVVSTICDDDGYHYCNNIHAYYDNCVRCDKRDDDTAVIRILQCPYMLFNVYTALSRLIDKRRVGLITL